MREKPHLLFMRTARNIKCGCDNEIAVADLLQNLNAIDHPARGRIDRSGQKRQFRAGFIEGDFHQPPPFTRGEEWSFPGGTAEEQSVYTLRNKPADMIPQGSLIDAVVGAGRRDDGGNNAF